MTRLAKLLREKVREVSRQHCAELEDHVARHVVIDPVIERWLGQNPLKTILVHRSGRRGEFAICVKTP